jgi:hypothetical protein
LSGHFEVCLISLFLQHAPTISIVQLYHSFEGNYLIMSDLLNLCSSSRCLFVVQQGIELTRLVNANLCS